jgi:predicted CopG family antitoxin
MDSRDDWRKAAFEERIKPYWDVWIERLMLGHWKITGDVASVIDGHTDAEAVCRVFKEQGHRATIIITDDVYERDEAERESDVIHELLHIPLDELAQFAERHIPANERDWFTRLIETFVADMTRCLYNLAHEDRSGNVQE